MYKLIILSILFSQLALAATPYREGDLQAPVTDLSQMNRQEQEETPTLDEVPMIEKEEEAPKKEVQNTKVKDKKTYSYE